MYQLEDRRVTADGEYFIADNAVVVGSVRLKNNASVWYGATIRGDNDTIVIGENSNIQDGSVLHTDAGVPLTVGDNVTIGHMVMLHGCSIGDGSLIGIGSVILNGAKIGKGCLVGANSLITEGKEFPDYSMILGSPAKVVRQLDENAVASLQINARVYVKNAQRFRSSLTPMSAADPHPGA
ncbi:MAG: gamma carbonic anhydrase family protein [Pseudomonadota bacterium]